MEKKINIAEILKDCPKDMELYSPIYGNGVLTKITNRIHVKFPKEHNVKCFRFDGKISEDGEVMLFPKGKTTWEGFQRPFKDGDIIFTHANCLNIGLGNTWISIFQEYCNGGVATYVDYAEVGQDYYDNADGDKGLLCMEKDILRQRLATEEEKQRLFDAIKVNGYKWNAETKTLDKLIRPKFKVGDRIVKKNSVSVPMLITKINDEFYYTNTESSVGIFRIQEQDDWELIHNKFDITTLKPFDKVLMRSSNERIWVATFYSHYYNNKFYGCGMYCNQCIPYEGNQHLLGTTNDCDDFYKTW